MIGKSTYAIPVIKYSPEKIFAGRIPALDINFVNPIDWNSREEKDKFTTQTGVETNIVGNANENGEAMNERSITRALHSTIASWYVALRNLALVALMLVLVYIGIRIVISSTASDKAKFKQMLMDWVVAICILFCLHYIMTFTTTIINEVTQAITGSASSKGNNVAIQVVDSNGSPTGTEFNTDLMGLIRFRMQSPNVGGKVLYLLLYFAMVIYTCMFTFYYLKRVLTMAFLTLISPLVALTYPIDKIRDGKAQAFDMWLKEYVFNALLQPFHLIIYSIFVGSAVDLAAKNPLFAIVTLAFITPAEKILRKFFGFEKAGTAGALGAVTSAFGGAAVYKALGSAISHGAKGSESKNKNNVRTKEKGRIEDPNSPGNLDGYTSSEGKSSEEQSNEEQKNEEQKAAIAKAMEEARRIQQAEELRKQQEELQRAQEEINKDSASNNNQRQGALGASSNSGQQFTTPSEKTKPVGRQQKARRGITGGMIGAGKAIRNRAATTLGNGRWWAKTGKAAIRTAGHAALRVGAATAVGALGVAAGIAGDEPEDIFKYGLGGAILGGTVGGNAAINTTEKIAGMIGGSAPVQGFIEGFTGKTSTERALERQKEELMDDIEFRQQIQQTYQPGGQELSGRDLMKATERAADLVSYGIDSSQLAKALRVEDDIMRDLNGTDMAEKQKAELAKTQATTAMKLAGKIKDPTKLADEKYTERLVSNWTKTIMSKNSALTEKEAQRNAEQVMRRVKKIHKMS